MQHTALMSEEEYKEEEELYCVCQQPDDGRHLVCCDNCEGWFHPTCMGKTVEVPPPPPNFGYVATWSAATTARAGSIPHAWPKMRRSLPPQTPQPPVLP